MYGHQKFKTGAIRSYGNVIAYASEFGGWKTPGTIQDEPMLDNKVFFVDGATYHGASETWWIGKRAHNNALVGRDIMLRGGKLTLAQWQAQDPATHDVGSTYTNRSISTQAKEIIAAARELLQL